MYPRRAYFPELARFGSSDPIGERGGINLYRAMRNNPLRYVDPMGLQDSEDIPATVWWNQLSGQIEAR